MDLTTGYPYWLIKDGLPFTYPSLSRSIKTEVAIIGGGISGALMAYVLVQAGIGCTLVDARSIGLGSTCASTSLLQYELDKPLHELSAQIGWKQAMQAYQKCALSIDFLQQISEKIKFTSFQKQKSLYFAAGAQDKKKIETEFRYRKKAGLNVQLLGPKEIHREFNFSAPAAILSSKAAATDAYLFAHALLQSSMKKGLQVYDRTKVVKLDYHPKHVILHTENKCVIHARYVVNASGYEIKEFLQKKIVQLQSTYAFASEQVKVDAPLWKGNSLLWNTANPYLYMRMTDDGRAIVGGRDEPYYNPEKRDRLIKQKTKQLRNDFLKIFPKISVQPEYSWTGTFGITKDSLPYIG
ncbi:MAG TPA: FAD-dependent oxidoreductase, partial [Cytophagaceae bacterium]|nr:FAD-dependent oxidoreductase [Cytophagaceae bacterium]